jgi:hypothetical protein
MKFLFLSGSAREESLEYTAAIHGNFKMYFTDATVLKSMIRSNPGLMLLKDGVILRKWNCRDLPSVEELNQIVNSKPADIIKKYKAKEAAITWAMIAIAGFLLLCFSFKTIKKHERRRHN